jgi:hypothetical protein
MRSAEAATEAGLESPLLPEPPSEELAAEAPATAEEPAAPAAPAPATEDASGSGFYDQSEGDLELDLDLSLDEEATRVEDTGEQAAPPAPPEPPPETGEAAAAEGPPATDERPAVEPPIESLDTVEHPFEGAVEETGEAEAVEGELTEEGAEPEEGADEDVLEETPEFLRDAPEDDELWFEQGEPKDFDF